MEARRFEELSRRVAAAQSRRSMLRAVVAGVGAVALGLGETGRADAAGETRGIPIYHCKPPGTLCHGKKRCCSGRCKKGVCTCAKRGTPCVQPLEGALCCSGRCRNGKCK
ncbi:MAG: hypothetical protein IT337_02575 [Thermomicrobiales bacterium]|nr:hypothetical protein [Thermomicrobiales bacterium]